jgi:hypothetical protein
MCKPITVLLAAAGGLVVSAGLAVPAVPLGVICPGGPRPTAPARP